MESSLGQKQHDPSYSKKTFLRKTLGNRNQPIVASTDYVKEVIRQIRAFLENDFYTLGTDGFGRSDSRKMLREFFEVDSKDNIARLATYALWKSKKISKDELVKIYKELNVQPLNFHPWEKFKIEESVNIPDLGDADNLEVIEICVNEGDQVNIDDPLIVSKSEKAAMEIPASSKEKYSIIISNGDEIQKACHLLRWNLMIHQTYQI